MGIKEEAGNYLRALSERLVTDRRCEQRTGQRGVVGGWVGGMMQSFGSVSPLETEGVRSERSKEFVLIGVCGPINHCCP